MTFDSPTTCDFGLAANAGHDNVVAVGPGVERIIGPFPGNRFTSAATGLVSVSYSGVTTVTVAVIRP